MLIQAFLNLGPGVFSIFYHSALAKHSAKKADDLSLYYILGVETFIALLFLATFSFIAFAFINQDFMNGLFIWIMAGIFLALSVVSFTLYFRKGRGTALFIPQKIKKGLKSRAESVKTRSDAFVLGLAAETAELPFTLPLFIIVSFVALKISLFPSFFALIFYILVATVPFFTLRAFFRGGLNLAEIQRLRVKNKPFFRLTITIAYLFLAFLIISLGVK